MAYVTIEDYKEIYSEEIPEKVFNTLEWEARKIVDNHTTGVDNVRKLRVAFPTAEDDAEAVKRCMCELIKLMYDIEQAQQRRSAGTGPAGAVTSGPVTSVSSGSESISYATSGGTYIDAAVSDISARNRLLNDTVRKNLSGVWDANGVCLLYMGVYPYV